MMAPLKLIAAIVAVLSAIVLEAAEVKSLWGIAHDMDLEWKKLSKPGEPEVVYSFAKEYLRQFQQKGVDELLKAWNRVLHEPDLCDESSLRYVATISRCGPEHKSSMYSLHLATKKYASKCLTLDHIKNRVEAQASVYSLESRFNNLTEFFDHQLIADYWLEHSEDKPLKKIEVYKATKAIAKAIARDSKSKTADLENTTQVQAFLKSRLYDPCFDYYEAFDDLDSQIRRAARYWKGDYDNLISSLDNDTQDALFRYKLCAKNEILSASSLVYNQFQSYETSGRVFYDLKALKRLTAS